MSVINTVSGTNRGVSPAHVAAQQIRDINLLLRSGDKVYINSLYDAERSATFMRVLMGVLAPTSGNLYISGRVFPFLLPSSGIRYRASVSENLIRRGLLAGLSMRDSKGYTEEILATDELSEYRICTFGILPRDIQLLILCRSLEKLEPQILILESWMVPTSDKLKEIIHAGLVNLIKKSSIAVISINRADLIKSLSNFELKFCGEQGIELIGLP